MRVTHVIASSRGGGAVHVSALARHQAVAGGHDVQVIVPDEGELARGELRAAGVELPEVGPSGPAWVVSLRRILGAWRPDLVVAHGARAALWARLAVAGQWPRPRPAVLYAFHGFTAPYLPRPVRVSRRLGEAALGPITTGYVCVCEAEREEAVRFGLPAAKMHVIPNGVELGRFDVAGAGGARESARARIRAELGVPEEMFLALTAGRLDRPRDPGLILRALGRAAGGQAQVPMGLLVAGEGPFRSEAEALARRLGLEGRVRFLGYRQDLPALLGAVDALVHVTSAWEGFPYAVLEAMAAGLPVVATRAGGIPEAVVDEVTGVLVPLGDEAALSAALGRLAADPGRARRMGEAGRGRVAERFTEATMCEAHEALHARVLFRR